MEGEVKPSAACRASYAFLVSATAQIWSKVGVDFKLPAGPVTLPPDGVLKITASTSEKPALGMPFTTTSAPGQPE